MSCDQQQIMLDRPLVEASVYKDQMTAAVSQQSPHLNNDSQMDGRSDKINNEAQFTKTSRTDVMQLHQEFDEFVKGRRDTIVSRKSFCAPAESKNSMD